MPWSKTGENRLDYPSAMETAWKKSGRWESRFSMGKGGGNYSVLKRDKLLLTNKGAKKGGKK